MCQRPPYIAVSSPGTWKYSNQDNNQYYSTWKLYLRLTSSWWVAWIVHSVLPIQLHWQTISSRDQRLSINSSFGKCNVAFIVKKQKFWEGGGGVYSKSAILMLKSELVISSKRTGILIVLTMPSLKCITKSKQLYPTQAMHRISTHQFTWMLMGML